MCVRWIEVRIIFAVTVWMLNVFSRWNVCFPYLLTELQFCWLSIDLEIYWNVLPYFAIIRHVTCCLVLLILFVCFSFLFFLRSFYLNIAKGLSECHENLIIHIFVYVFVHSNCNVMYTMRLKSIGLYSHRRSCNTFNVNNTVDHIHPFMLIANKLSMHSDFTPFCTTNHSIDDACHVTWRSVLTSVVT